MQAFIQPLLGLYVNTQQRVMAATPDPGNPWDGNLSKPDGSWFNSFKPMVNQLSGWTLFGIGLIAILMILVGAVAFTLAGKRKDKSQEASLFITNALKGIGIAFIGLPIAVALLGALSRIS
jgi:hypothetical protein